jgi:hypothetical protein
MLYSLLSKTFGGLSRPYYFRQLFFGLLFACIFFSIGYSSGVGLQPKMLAIAIAGAVLYPYSRFVYDSILEFFMGDNVIELPLMFALMKTVFGIGLCFLFAPFIAPVGLLFLLYHHSKEERNARLSNE